MSHLLWWLTPRFTEFLVGLGTRQLGSWGRDCRMMRFGSLCSLPFKTPANGLGVLCRKVYTGIQLNFSRATPYWNQHPQRTMWTSLFTALHPLPLKNYTPISGFRVLLPDRTTHVLGRPSISIYGVLSRNVVTCSKLGKRKTVKSVAKRFQRTGSGKLKFWPPGKTHNMLAKLPKKRRQLRKARYVTKTQLKTLNKMIAGW